MKRRVLLLAATVALIAGAAFFGGYRVGARPAPSASHPYTLRTGDRSTPSAVTVPALKAFCDLSDELPRYASPNASGPLHPVFTCQRTGKSTQGPYYVVFLRNRIQVWKSGNTLHPVWGGP